MKLNVDGIQFNILLNKTDLNQNKTAVIFLHGFTGCADDWNFIFDKLPSKFFPIAIDLIGHGKTDSPEDQNHYTCSAIVHHLNSITESLGLKNFLIVGYSMGGRAALSFSLKYPHKVIAAVLESATAGIQDISQKKDRVEFDLLLAEKIKKEGVKSFTEFWFNMPLFARIKKLPAFEEIKNKRTANSVTGLSNGLCGFSTGLMPSYWERLSSIHFPVLLISGEFDLKYTGINKSMRTKFPNAQHQIFSKCGHNTHLEKPELFTKFVVDFLNSL